ncbi:hypothetical protein ES703_68233 [subsurface metagenome]
MDIQPQLVPPGNRIGQGIKPAVPDERALGNQQRVVVGVAPSPYLYEDVIEAAFPGEGEGGVDLLAIHHTIPHDPQTPDTQRLQLFPANTGEGKKKGSREGYLPGRGDRGSQEHAVG